MHDNMKQARYFALLQSQNSQWACSFKPPIKDFGGVKRRFRFCSLIHWSGMLRESVGPFEETACPKSPGDNIWLWLKVKCVLRSLADWRRECVARKFHIKNLAASHCAEKAPKSCVLKDNSKTTLYYRDDSYKKNMPMLINFSSSRVYKLFSSSVCT